MSAVTPGLELSGLEAVYAFPYTSAPATQPEDGRWHPGQEDDQWKISEPTRAVCLAAAGLSRAYGVPVAVSGEIYPNGYRTALDMKEAMIEYGVPEDEIVKLASANSTATQTREFERWRRQEGIENAVGLVHDNHARRVSRTRGLQADLMSVSGVLESGLDLPAPNEEVARLAEVTRYFDFENKKYENSVMLRGFTEVSRLGGLTVMSAAFGAISRGNPNVLDVIGDGTAASPFRLVQGRYKEFFS